MMVQAAGRLVHLNINISFIISMFVLAQKTQEQNHRLNSTAWPTPQHGSLKEKEGGQKKQEEETLNF